MGDTADRSFAYPADSRNLPLLQTILLHGPQADTSPWVGLGLASHRTAAATRTKSSRLFCAIKWKTISCYFLFPPRKKSQFHRLKAHVTARCTCFTGVLESRQLLVSLRWYSTLYNCLVFIAGFILLECSSFLFVLFRKFMYLFHDKTQRGTTS